MEDPANRMGRGCAVAVGACARGDLAGGGQPPPGPAATKAPAAPARAEWETRWETTLAAARKEGKVMVASRWPADVRGEMNKAFKEKYGIDIQFIIGRSEEVLAKVLAERRAGLYLLDAILEGGASLTVTWRGAGLLEPIEPQLLLPEVRDGKSWMGGKLHFIDPDNKVLMFYARTGATIVINTEMVKDGDLKSYRNLLDPKWKDRIISIDPTMAGSGNAFITALGEIMGLDFVRALARQNPVLTRDLRLHIESVAKGKYPIGLGPEPPMLAEFRTAGAPLAHIVPQEGTWSGAGGGGLGLVTQPANPNAARIFTNWFLSREGQTVVVQAAKEQSRRLDVTTEFIDADRRIQSSIKYVDGDTEYMIQKREEMKKLAVQIFAAQLK